MTYSTTLTSKVKRSLFNFAAKISDSLKRPEQKFIADMVYGISASGSCMLSRIAQELKEDTKIVNTIDRLSRHLQEGVDPIAELNYCNEVIGMVPENAIVHIDDSDAVKPCGKEFEDLCIVRDGSESTKDKAVLKPGYHIAEATAMTKSGHPVSLFSKVYSTKSADYSSAKDVTFESIHHCLFYLGHATFIMDRGYDDNKVFQKFWEIRENFVIRLKMNRKVFLPDKGEWVVLEELCRNEEDWITHVRFRRHGEERNASLVRVKGRLSAGEQDISIIIVRGLADHPLVLATNLPTDNAAAVVYAAGLYFTRWRIEEYFRSKKELFDAENFRVRKLAAINALNFHISVCMAFLAERADAGNGFSGEIIDQARPLKKTVSFLYYRLSSGVARILNHTRSGIRGFFPPLRPNQRQLRIQGFLA